MRRPASIWCVAGCLALAGAATASDWRLAGTLQTGSGAVVLETSQGQQLLRVNGYVGECRLDAVARRSAVFTCAEHRQTLPLGAKPGAEATIRDQPEPDSSHTMTLAREQVRARIADRQGLVGELSLEPLVGESGIEGYRLRHVPAGSLAAQAGFKVDDILRSINGVSVSAGSAFTNMLNNLGDAYQLQVEVERDGVRLQTLLVLN